MNTNRLGAGAFLLALAGCAPMAAERGSAAPADKFNPEVQVIGGEIDAPVALQFKRSEKGKITWHLKDKGYSFALADGIRFEPNAAGEIVECHRENNEMKFSCVNLHNKAGQSLFYKYTINVVDPQGKGITKDPFVLND